MLALSSLALALSLASAVSYSASDYFRKAVPASCSAPLLLFLMVAGQIPILGAWLIIVGDFHLSEAYLVPGLSVAVIGFAANTLFILAVRRSPLSLMIPMLGLIPALTTLFSGLLIDEWPETHQIVGISLVSLGLLLLFAPAGSAFSLVEMLANLRREPGVKPMAGVVILWSIAPPIDKACVEHSSVGMHGLIQLTLIATAAAVWVAWRGGVHAFAIPRMSARPIVGAVLSSGLAYAFQLAAYQTTLVAVVELIKRTVGILGSLVLGRTMFNEPATPVKIMGMIIMVVGLPLVILS
jgi:drug/metabolite transporter (DMT)-like permease